MNERVQVGYLCSRGHFQLNDDPEGDSCQTKNIAPIYVEIEDQADTDYILENIQDALALYNRKLEEWRGA